MGLLVLLVIVYCSCIIKGAGEEDSLITHITYILVHCLRDPAIAYQGDDQHQNLAIIWRLSYTHCGADAGCGIDQKC